MITKLRYGNTNTFLISGDKGGILIDTDYAGTMPGFYKAIKLSGIKVEDITYVMATHYHPDHCGLIGGLMDQGVKLVVMESQTGFVHYPDKIFEKEPRLEYKPVDDSRAVVMRFEGSRSFLESLGINGEIIPTASHSKDSVSVILDDGTVIAGDLEPFEYLEAYDCNRELKADWDILLGYSPKRILYAHANEKVIDIT